MSDVRIGPDREVTLHFALKLENGDVVDSTFDKQPATFKVGDGNLLPGFEQALYGFKAGDKRSVQVQPEQGFGQPNPQNVQDMKRKDFPVDMPVAPGLMVSFADAQGAELPGVISRVEGDWVSVDFNHPLAGRTLMFEVQILNVENGADA